MPEGSKVAEVTLRVQYAPGDGNDHPADWDYVQLLDLPDAAHVRVVAARNVPGLDPDQDPED